MIDDLWDKPVELMIDGPDHFHCVGNSREAVACLSNSWPGEHDALYATARRTCLKAIEGKVRSEEAQAAFINAAENAGILRH